MKGSLSLFLLTLFFLHSFVSAQGRFPPGPDDALLFQEGETLFEKGETEKALWRFKRLVVEHPKSPLLNEAKFRMGICYTRLKRPKEAIRVLTELLSTFLAPPRMLQVFSLLGDNSLQAGDPINSLHWYGKGLLVQGQPKDELKVKIRTIIDGFETEEVLLRVESLYRGAYAGGYAKLRLASMVRRRGDVSSTRRILSDLERNYTGMDYLPQARELLGSTRVPEKSTYTIGVILPLSGNHQTFGTRVLQAIQLAARDSPPQRQEPLLSLSIRDSKGNAREAERSVEDLLRKDKVIAILGPLLSASVEPAAGKAQQMKVPMMTFSQKETSTGAGDFIFQNALTPAAQVQALLDYAMRERELRTFAVFYPNSPYGVLYKNLFNQEVYRRAGKVLGSVAYQEEQTDFSHEIKGFFRIKTTPGPDDRKKGGESFQPGFAVDAIFIPDTYDRAGLLLAQMAYYDVDVQAFLGPNAWNNPRLISIAGSAAERALFVDCFFKENGSSPVRSFVTEFRRNYHKDPETLEAIGYDAMRFLMEILQAGPLKSSLSLREEIIRKENFQGVSGLKGFGEKGKAVREILILTVRENRIVQVHP